MSPTVAIIGQGIAGSMLAWACERGGIDFVIYDAGHADAASRVGAGLVSPLTGQRLVPTWRMAEWRERALSIYRGLEVELGIAIVREMRLRRIFRDSRQRERFTRRLGRPEVAPWIEAVDGDGLWLRGALQVETGTLIATLRRRWLAQGRLHEHRIDVSEQVEAERVIWCAGATESAVWNHVPWERSRGEILGGRMRGLASDVVLNDGKWLLPWGDDRVRVGATFDRGDLTAAFRADGRRVLMDAAERLGTGWLEEPTSMVGFRTTVPDRRPVVGWRQGDQRTGILGGLAAKGALWAPVLAAQWVDDGLRGERIDGEARADRFSL